MSYRETAGLNTALSVMIVFASSGWLSPAVVHAVDRSAEREQSITLLEKIRKAQAAARTSLQNFSLKGRLGQVGVPWGEGAARMTLESMPLPKGWNDFSLVQRGSKGRYEEQFRVLLDGPDDQRVYRVRNAEGIAKLDGTALYLHSVEDPQVSWFQQVGFVYSCTTGFDGRTFAPLEIVCESLVRTLREMGDDIRSGVTIPLRCVERDGLLVIEAASEQDAYEASFTMTIDPAKGFNIVRMRIRNGGSGQGIDNEMVRELVIDEFLPGVFFARRGQEFVENLGSVDKRDKKAGWGLKQFIVDEIQTGDFEYDEGQFDWKSLPIPAGAHVEDRRVDPPLTFKYGQSPLDEEVMKAALAARPVEPPSTGNRGWILVAANVVAFAILAAIFIKRRRA